MALLCTKLDIPPEFSMEERLYRPAKLADSARRLRILEAAIAADLKVMEYPSVPLPYVHDEETLEVAIIGAGQSGKSMAFGLRRYGCHNVRVFDRGPKGRQGPWRTFARNHLLRTKKDSTGGLEWGMPNLHFHRWCDAVYGEDYFLSIKKIPRTIWADYLDWYGDLLNLPVAYETDVTDIAFDKARDRFMLTTSRGPVLARFVVIATGIESAGQRRYPDIVAQALPAHAYTHTMVDLAVEDVSGRAVVVIGGGASAFDTANAALDAGARCVDLMVRRPNLPQAHRSCWGSKWNGYHRHYIELPDEMKWAYSLADLDLGVPPPRDTYYEAIRDPRFTLYGSAGIDALSYRNGKIVGTYGGTRFQHDFMVCGTGARNTVLEQTELKSLIPLVRLWRDVYIPNQMATHPELEMSPYLGPALQFTPKDEADAYVGRVYYLCSGVAHLSGFRCNLSGLQYAAPRICHDISKQLFLAHAPEIKAAFDAHDAWE